MDGMDTNIEVKKRKSKWGPLLETKSDSDVVVEISAEMKSQSVENDDDNSLVFKSMNPLPLQGGPMRNLSKKPKMVIKSIRSIDDFQAREQAELTQTVECNGETDTKGYYRCKISEVLDGRYRVMSVLGQGVFASVVRCLPLSIETCQPELGQPALVAIKVVCVILLLLYLIYIFKDLYMTDVDK